MSEQALHIPEWTQGWRMRRALADAGMSAEQMADEMGVHRTTVSRWLNDEGPVRKAFLNQWALRCGVPLEWLRGTDLAPSIRGYVADSRRYESVA